MRLALSLSLPSLLWLALGAAALGQASWSVTSPDGKLAATLALQEQDGKAAAPVYRVDFGPKEERKQVLAWSPLGLVREDHAFAAGLSFKGKSDVRAIDETYALLGKRSTCRATAREQAFTFVNAAGQSIEIVFRVSNDGVAFRYRFPEIAGRVRVTKELTGFYVGQGRAWMSPYQESSKYAPGYEDYYSEAAIGTDAPLKTGWAFPALFHLEAGPWMLITEAATDGTYCGCRLAKESAGGRYQIRFPDPEEGWGQGAVEPTIAAPWAGPWRVVMVGDSPAVMVESTLVTDLNPPSRLTDTAWIKPGRVTWSWWSDHDSPQDYRKLTEFVDLAGEMGWEYFLVDANWDLMDNGNVRELAQYAQKKNVRLLLWYNSGGEHNIVTEKPRGAMKAPEVRQFELEMLKKWGVAGIKVDFFQSDKQNILALYHGILEDAAKAQILVNFHGCTVPRGWERTWPHLMSMEGVKGEECYTFGPEYPAKAPAYNTMLPFTRNAVGPMDYTPCALTDDRFPHKTTNAHEIALTVVFQSNLLHFADRVSAYRQLPAEPKAFLRDVPVVWDETRWVAGEPGKLAVVARRKGNRWYVGAINGQNQAVKLSVPLGFLGQGNYRGALIGDGAEPRTLADRPVEASARDNLELSMLPFGGAVLQLTPLAK